MIVNADCVQWAQGYDGPLFHAMFCDPPYELGFMGKDWDASGIAFDPNTWRAFMRVLHPGAFGMAFASSRGWHRMAVAIEDAGFRIHPSIFAWAFGSGFPKATRIDTQIDKAMGAERDRVAENPFTKGRKFGQGHHEGWERPWMSDPNANAKFITKPATELAQQWEGHRYGLQALKPAIEPIIVFQKPYPKTGKTFESIAKTGAGALNVDAGRVGADVTVRDNNKTIGGNGIYQGGKAFVTGSDKGRWPSNFLLQHHPECNGNCHPECPVERLDAARFFFQYQQDQLDAADPVRYQAKASRKERDAGLNDMPEHSATGVYSGRADGSLGKQTDPKRNPHPTVKPLGITKYISTILLPPDAYAPRRLFVPFSGVGSEMIGAFKAGWDEVTGIEQSQEYCSIAQQRIDHWCGQPQQLELV